jgi:Glyoxalase/Bleomycin resistance protein/Dioxygenase superfamily
MRDTSMSRLFSRSAPHQAIEPVENKRGARPPERIFETRRTYDVNNWLGTTPIAKIVTDHWVKDLDSAIDRYTSDYKLGPFKIADLKAPLVHDVEFRGRPADIHWRAAMAEVGPLAIELLEVRGGSDDVVEWASTMADGYWHLTSYHRTVEEAEKAARRVAETNAELVLSGRVGGSRFFMFETGGLFGRMFEVAGGDLGAVSFEDGHGAARPRFAQAPSENAG